MADAFDDPLERAWMRAQVRNGLFGGDAVVRVDRFELRERLGAGAMGSVWRAYDPELSREVAIKILFGDDADGLKREAQAMARLRHPNVVAVHEIGTWEGIAFVAMERVEGPTVRAWLGEQRRSVAEVLAVFGGAGRGLAAAHAAGLIHRDFKPDNVLVDSSGMARVADFGLAHTDDAAASDVAGTPAYMAPEQLRGRGATARSDQFAFAAALFEALYGHRPFVGTTLDDLAAAIEAGDPRPHDGGRMAVGTVPPAARRAIVRALSSDPAARFTDMNALLRELVPPPRRTAWWLAAALLVALAATTTWIALRPSGAAAVDRCGGAEVALAASWDATRGTAVRTAIAGGGKPYSAAAAARTVEILDDYARRWRLAHRRACEASRTQPRHLMEARQLCLDERRRVLGALAARLAASGGAVGEHAVEAASSLPPLDRCDDLEALRDRKPLPDDPAARARVLALFDDLASAHAAYLAGNYREAVDGARAVIAAAAPLGHAPLDAEALLLAGMVGASGGDREGVALLERAYNEAIAAADDNVAAQAAAGLAQIIGSDDEQVAEGKRWLAAADAHLRRVGDDPALRAKLINVEANLAQAAGDYAAAQAGFVRAQEAWRAIPGRTMDLGGALHNEGNALNLLGRSDEAVARHRDAVATWRELLGDDHPLLAMAHSNLGMALRNGGKLDEALAELERALAIYRASSGEKDPEVAMALDAIGSTQSMRGAHAEALPYFERARAIVEASLGPEHVLIAVFRTNRGQALIQLGRLDEAEADLRAALERKQAVRGADHPTTSVNHSALGEIAGRRGRHRDSLAHYQRALAVLTPSVPADSPRLGDALFGIAQAQHALGDRRAARATMQRVVTILTASPAHADDLARATRWLTDHPE